MTTQVKIIDNQTVVVLPEEMVARLCLGDQSEVGVVASPNGVEIVVDLQRARQLEIARGVMRDDRDALAELAK
jgi:antitoxin component of MazEF toxin-antitoxin module